MESLLIFLMLVATLVGFLIVHHVGEPDTLKDKPCIVWNQTVWCKDGGK